MPRRTRVLRMRHPECAAQHNGTAWKLVLGKQRYIVATNVDVYTLACITRTADVRLTVRCSQHVPLVEQCAAAEMKVAVLQRDHPWVRTTVDCFAAHDQGSAHGLLQIVQAGRHRCGEQACHNSGACAPAPGRGTAHFRGSSAAQQDTLSSSPVPVRAAQTQQSAVRIPFAPPPGSPSGSISHESSRTHRSRSDLPRSSGPGLGS